MRTKKKKLTDISAADSLPDIKSLHDAADQINPKDCTLGALGETDNKELLLQNVGFSSTYPDLTTMTAAELIHSLKVHQVELEIQAEELKNAYLTIEESRDQFRDLYEFAPLGYLTLTDSAIISQANLTAASLFSVGRINLVNTRFRTWVASDDLEIWDRYFLNLLKTEKKLTACITLKRCDGSTFPARFESIKLNQKISGYSIRMAISDISDVRTIEKALKRSEERFQLALKNVPVSVAVQNLDLVYEWAYNQGAFAQKNINGKSDYDIFPPNEARYLIDLKQQTIRSGKEFHEKIWLTLDGSQAFFDMYIKPLRNDAGITSGIGIAAVDLTEQKNIEDALRNSEENLIRAQELLEAVTKGTKVIIAAQDTQFRYIYFNQTYKEEIQHITGKNLAVGMSMIDVFSANPMEQEREVKEWNKVMKGENVNNRVIFESPGSHQKIYHVLHSPIRDTKGSIIGAGEVAFDITKQVQVENALRETKEYLNNLIKYASAPIIVWDNEYSITLFNQASEHLTGRKSKDVIGNHLITLFPTLYQEKVMELILKTRDGERWESLEIPILHKGGEIRTVLWNSASIYGEDGIKLVSTIAQGQDISDRKKIENAYKQRVCEYEKINIALSEEIIQRNIADTALKNTLSLLNATLESTADGILVTDLNGRITSYNQNFLTMWDIAQSSLETRDFKKILETVSTQLNNPEYFLSSSNDFTPHQNRESFDMVEFNDGKIFERYSKPQKIDNKIVGRVWSFRDITDRKHAEESLVSSLEEKEVLLREIHHRVKNNLQLISGLLDMTRMRTSDESTYNVLTDMILKIQTMAQIHTRLYDSKQFGKINIIDQIRDQVAALSNIYSHKGHKISCEINGSELFLPVDKALPCALVINEILSNAYKHAFIGRKKGTIEISTLQENEKIRIDICDNGIGIPNNCDLTISNSLGVKLIRALVQHQLKGNLTISCDSGTRVVVEFPLTQEGT